MREKNGRKLKVFSLGLRFRRMEYNCKQLELWVGDDHLKWRFVDRGIFFF